MKTTKSYFAILLSALFFTACASTHPGLVGKSVSTSANMNLKISAKWNKSYSDDSNIFVDFTMENATGTWAHIDQVDVDFIGDPSVAHNMIVSNDLKAWADSMSIKEKKSEFNTQMGIAGLVATGAVLMVAAAASGGRNAGNTAKGVAAAGAAAYTVGAGASVYHSVNKELTRVERGFTVPESHILAPVTIPSSGFAQRWMLVNVPAGVKNAAKVMRLRVHTAEGEEGVFDIPLDPANGRQKI